MTETHKSNKNDNDEATQSSPFLSKNYQECQRVYQKIQSMFPNVHMISSQELVRMQQEAAHNPEKSGGGAAGKILLVDVRSRAEQVVSILRDAVPLSQVDKILAHQWNESNDDELHVVTYCTVGFRGCLEAQRLQKEYPGLKVSSLDGIACYSHQQVYGAKQNSEPAIVEPHTNRPVQRVHAFGKRWDNCIHESYEAPYFSPSLMTAHSIHFGLGLAHRTLQGKMKNYLPKME